MSTWTLKENSTGEMIVTIEGDEWKDATRKAYSKIAKNAEVKGFRKGQVPAEILKQKIGPREIQIQAIEDNANVWLVRGLDELKLSPISRPEMDLKSVDENGAQISYTFAVNPEVKVGQYKGLDYAIEDVTVTDEEFQKELDRMRANYADLNVKDGAAEKGDTVNIDYEGFKQDVPFEGGKAENYNLELGSNSFIPGFEDQLIGCKAGEEKEINLKFPEDYHAEDLKGQDVVFKVKVNEVKTKVLPELDDDFAKDVNAPGVETADDLKKLVRQRMEDSKKQSAEQKADSQLLEKVSGNSDVEIPDILVQDEINRMIEDLNQKISQYGMKMEQYLSMMGKKVEDLKKDYEEEAKKSVKLRLVLAKIAEIENLEPEEEKITQEYQKIADAYKMDVEKVKELIDKELLKDDLRNQMAYDLVKESAAKKDASETKEK